MDDIATAIRRQREAQRMTQEHLADAAGVSARTVQRAERGDPLSAEAARALCAVLGLDAAALPPRPATAGTDEGGAVAPAGGLVRLMARLGKSTGAAEALGGLAGAAMAAWGAARLADGAASGVDTALLGVGASLVATMAMDRAWRWAGLYAADYRGRASLAFRGACAAVAALPVAWSVSAALG
jgi:transcriptional regulator with XRE-family HTH domain